MPDTSTTKIAFRKYIPFENSAPVFPGKISALIKIMKQTKSLFEVGA